MTEMPTKMGKRIEIGRRAGIHMLSFSNTFEAKCLYGSLNYPH